MDRIIATRALNYLRLAHTPSYVALRLLLNSTAFTHSDIAISALVEEMAVTESNRIFEIARFKKLDSDGLAEFRDYSIPAPTHALAEAYSLFHLTRIGVLQRRTHVFSYRPPPTHLYPRNFEHFGSGYTERNEAVRAALTDGRVAVVFDMKNCYPSIDGNAAFSRLREILSVSSALSLRQKRVIENCAAACLDRKGGLRVGPEMSHLMADLALQVLDNEAVRAFSDYFRYVDDVVIVCDQKRAEHAADLMRSCAENAGFELNREKTAVATAEVWSQFRNPFTPRDGSFDPLSGLKFRIKLFLSRHPQEIGTLAARLKREGIFLPLAAFQQAALAYSWRDSILHLLQRRWSVLLRYWFDTTNAVVDAALQCQATLRAQAIELLKQQRSEHRLARRWQVQHARFVINRSMYFLSEDELSTLLDFAAQTPELAETCAVLRALARNDFGEVVVMPGPAASAAAQLSATRGVSPELAFAPNIPPDIVAEVVSQFAVRGFAPSPVKLEESSDDAWRLARFATGDDYGPPEIPRWTYGGEVESLGVGTTIAQRAELAASRMFESEGIMLEALALSSSYGS